MMTTTTVNLARSGAGGGTASALAAVHKKDRWPIIILSLT
jgi:hypothetical protein